MTRFVMCLLLLFTTLDIQAAAAADKDTLLEEMLALSLKIDPELEAMSEPKRQRVFRRRLARYAGTHREFNVLHTQYTAIWDKSDAPLAEEELQERNGFDTYIKPDASVLGKPPLPDIIKKRHNWDDIPRFMIFFTNT